MIEPPVLYSFRRCPYAIRARMALAYAGISPEIREVHLKNKPTAMLAASAKGTVPVLVLSDSQVIDESLAVMHWAIRQSDPDHWLVESNCKETDHLIKLNDGPFKARLDQYKYVDRHPEHTEQWYREQALPFLQDLNQRLKTRPWLMGSHMQLADVALFPFIRQFAMVDRAWFDNAGIEGLRHWLDTMLELPLFKDVMLKRDLWVESE